MFLAKRARPYEGGSSVAEAMQFPSSNLLPGMAQERAFSKAWGLNPFSVTYGLAILSNLQTFMLNMLMCRTSIAYE